MKPLADTPSGLLRQATTDAIKISNTPGYTLRMTTWVKKTQNECFVCMAGACMVRSLGVKVRQEDVIGPSSTGDDLIARKLYAINSMREGNIYSAITTLNITPSVKQYKEIKKVQFLIKKDFDYIIGRAKWSTYYKAARMLERAGL